MGLLSLALTLINSISDPEARAREAAGLKPVEPGALFSQVARLAYRLDRLIVKMVLEGLDEGSLPRIRGLLTALEELHDLLIMTCSRFAGQPNTLTAHSLASMLMADALSALEADLDRFLGSELTDPAEVTGWAEGAARLIQALSVFHREAIRLSPSAPAHELLPVVQRLLPGRAELANYVVLLALVRQMRHKRKELRALLAELISRWLLRRPIARSGCLRLADLASEVAGLLGLKIDLDEVVGALDTLRKRGELLAIDTKRGIAVLAPRGEDLERAFELARERYKMQGSGITPQFLSQHLGWCPDYASAVVEELVRRKWLFPGPSQIIPGAVEYYPPPEE